MRKFLVSLAVVLAATLAACSAFDTKSAENAVSLFHTQLNAGKFDDVYKDTSADFRKVTTQQSFSELLASINGKLGKVKDSKMVEWKMNSGTGGTLATLTYDTNFENGPVTELFNFEYAGEKPLLLAYNIKSKTPAAK